MAGSENVVAFPTTENPTVDVDQLEKAARAYVATLTRWRTYRGLTQRELAEATFYDPSRISHIERGRQAPTEEFTRAAEDALGTGGELWDRWEDWRLARWGDTLAVVPKPPPWQPLTDQLQALTTEIAALNRNIASLLAQTSQSRREASL